jgi:type IV secretory pathway VirB10-like protein
MEISKATIAVVAASCITVGAAGAFLISRSAGSPAAIQSAPAAAVTPTAGVEQSEDVVTSTPTAAPADAAPVQEPATHPPAAGSPRAKSEPARPARVVPPKRAPIAATSPTHIGEQARAAVPDPRPTLASAVSETPKTASAEPVRTAPPAPVAPAEPPAPKFTDLVVSTDSVLGLQMETAVSSERARVEDEVVARVTRDVRVGDHVAIPAGARAYGNVTLVDRGGKLKDPARLGIKFTSVVLADGTRVPLETETIYRDGESPAGASTAKIGGGAIGGAILGGIFGGAKGAVIGATAGGGAGTAAVMAGGRNAATLAAGTPVTVRLVKPATVTVEEQ